MRTLHTRLVLLLWPALALDCTRGPVPIKEPALGPPDVLELFHRGRFAELERLQPGAVEVGAGLDGPVPVDAAAALMRAYREGDASRVLSLAASLPPHHDARRIVEALLRHVDVARPLRASSSSRGLLVLALSAEALDRGHPIVSMEIRGQRLRMLWDTGATDTILTPAVADGLGLAETRVQVVAPRGSGRVVYRLAAAGVERVDLGPWSLHNVPILVAELDSARRIAAETDGIDGFLSPQLLLGEGCFLIDRRRASLSLGLDRDACVVLMAGATRRAPLFVRGAEVYAIARIDRSPDIAVQLETGSAVSFLRADAARWLPLGAIAADPGEREGELAHTLRRGVRFEALGRVKLISAIDLGEHPRPRAHDDLATLGNDVLLQEGGVAVSFVARELGAVGSRPSGGAPSAAPGLPRLPVVCEEGAHGRIHDANEVGRGCGGDGERQLGEG